MRKGFCYNVQGISFVENEEVSRQLLTHKEVRHKTMKCDICDYSTNGIASLTHHQKIHYTLSDPEQKQSESISILYLWKMFSGKVKS